MKFVLDHPDVARSPSFSSDLSPELQSEVEELLSWGSMAEQKVMGATPKTFSNLMDLTANLRLESAVRSNSRPAR